MTRIVCAGHVNWDVTLRVDRLPEADGEARITGQTQAGGGSASNTAAVLAGLGIETTLIGSVGADEHGLLARRELDAVGVDTELVETTEARTTVKYLVVDGEGSVMVLGNEGANEAFRVDDVDTAAVRRADHLHLSSQRAETARALADIAANAGASVSFAPGRRVADRAYDPLVRSADVLFLNEREAEMVEADGLLSEEQVVVVTRGEDGAELRHGGETVADAGVPVDPVDTSGAGDAFAAGFLAAREERDPADALAVANVCGALATRGLGARTYLSWADVEPMLDIE
ncbi:carbohydrate kinase family protein [Halapricum sp. CBA1109]|uniref:carbohydrate kinase family protein n=1 Tax=Halapricum sp. CBA1109 TaxID=2668068 RepID=UPI0013B5CCB4|nr:carbohydrate kinase family protein [Halapricum sp. CBA1109]